VTSQNNGRQKRKQKEMTKLTTRRRKATPFPRSGVARSSPETRERTIEKKGKEEKALVTSQNNRRQKRKQKRNDETHLQVPRGNAIPGIRTNGKLI
jgi:hypothetical protein